MQDVATDTLWACPSMAPSLAPGTTSTPARAGRDKLKQARMEKGHWPIVVQDRRRQCGVILLGVGTAHRSGLSRGKDGRPNGFSPDVLLLSGNSGGISSRSCVLDWCAFGWRLRLYERRAPRRISL